MHWEETGHWKGFLEANCNKKGSINQDRGKTVISSNKHKHLNRHVHLLEQVTLNRNPNLNIT